MALYYAFGFRHAKAPMYAPPAHLCGQEHLVCSVRSYAGPTKVLELPSSAETFLISATSFHNSKCDSLTASWPSSFLRLSRDHNPTRSEPYLHYLRTRNSLIPQRIKLPGEGIPAECATTLRGKSFAAKRGQCPQPEAEKRYQKLATRAIFLSVLIMGRFRNGSSALAPTFFHLSAAVIYCLRPEALIALP